MRQLDLSPLYRSTVGFDHLFNLVNQAAAGFETAPSYPPYNIEHTVENLPHYGRGGWLLGKGSRDRIERRRLDDPRCQREPSR